MKIGRFLTGVIRKIKSDVLDRPQCIRLIKTAAIFLGFHIGGNMLCCVIVKLCRIFIQVHRL